MKALKLYQKKKSNYFKKPLKTRALEVIILFYYLSIWLYL